VPSVTDLEQVRQTANLIDSSPVELTLKRAPKVTSALGDRDATGGVAPAGPREPLAVPVRVFLGAKAQDGLPLQDSQGERVVAFYVIVAMPDTDIQVGDEFEHNNVSYKVTSVATHLPYEIKADVQTYYGGTR
jgi:hypothetical protein